MALLMILIERAIKRAFGDIAASRKQTGPHNTPPNQKGTDIVETIWAGMESSQLRATFGPPQKINFIPNGEMWTYPNLNGSGTRTEIDIVDGKVKKWQDVTDTLPYASNS